LRAAELRGNDRHSRDTGYFPCSRRLPLTEA
jgi:hypothetical protein